MFGFLAPQMKDETDPLQSSRSVSSWLRQLPTQDVIGRQHQVMQVFDAMRQSRRPVDLNRIAAVQFLDTALGAERRHLIRQFVENIDRSARIADRAWQAAQELSQGFVYAYQTSLEWALSEIANPKWRNVVPQLFSRLVHYHGTDAKLRAFRHERWIPAKWTVLHQLYASAFELGIAKLQVALPSAGPGAMLWSTSQEYAYALLVQQLNTGNLTPAEIDWAGVQLRAWGRKLEFETVPKSTEGFYVDLSSKRGLVRRAGSESGPMMHYLDTTPLADQLERAIHALRQTDVGEPGSAVNLQRIAILEKVRPVIAPNLHGDLRRSPRTAVTVAAKVRIGLARICNELAPKEVAEPANDAHAGAEEIEVFAVADAPRGKRRAPDEHDTLLHSIMAFSDPAWHVKDRSVAGLRIAASGGIGQSLVLGALVAVRQSDAVNGCWAPCVVSTRFRTTMSKQACRSSPTASSRSPSTPSARRKTTSASRSSARRSRP